jgi:hypothetical protein
MVDTVRSVILEVTIVEKNPVATFNEDTVINGSRMVEPSSEEKKREEVFKEET